jgi:hypothetical protein
MRLEMHDASLAGVEEHIGMPLANVQKRVSKVVLSEVADDITDRSYFFIAEVFELAVKHEQDAISALSSITLGIYSAAVSFATCSSAGIPKSSSA